MGDKTEGIGCVTIFIIIVGICIYAAIKDSEKAAARQRGLIQRPIIYKSKDLPPDCDQIISISHNRWSYAITYVDRDKNIKTRHIPFHSGKMTEITWK